MNDSELSNYETELERIVMLCKYWISSARSIANGSRFPTRLQLIDFMYSERA